MSPEQIRAAFTARFGRSAEAVSRAPGRVNLIGEHTDYNAGYVLPVATQQSTWVAAAISDDATRVHSVGLDEEHHWSAGDWRSPPCPRWTAYVAGVLELLRRRGVPLGELDLLIHSDVPVGGGLSSSAALTVAVAKAACALTGQDLSVRELAALCRAAENEFAGVPCGVMDQYASIACRAGEAILLDCRGLEYEHVPLSLGDHGIVVVDSAVRHELASSEYAKRQQQCAEALAVLRRSRPDMQTLRDADAAMVQAAASQMGAIPAARARHVCTENERTLAAVAALRGGNLAEVGRLMEESHKSLRDDYEVSCAELDLLVDIVSSVSGVVGARMTGGGFGGCIVAIARRDAIGRIEQALRDHYDIPGRTAGPFAVEPGAGAAIEYP